MGKEFIGLSWEPKLPSLPMSSSALATDPPPSRSCNSGINLKEPEIGGLWLPKGQLIDGLFVPPTDPRR
ncbi:hypothetical protein MLD38_017919 [Melastoma candidum]|uniref:Uncharacterized protein n=1 Tax=Melastoma candidum TaxID=119954 RepID=A0ACB9QVQ2_9MYRT|nr:hypothetical protein MLD38_017919 [Melastoma candidum]